MELTWVQFVMLYPAVCFLCYCDIYFDGAESEGRIPLFDYASHDDKRAWRCLVFYCLFRGKWALRLLILDFLKIHCPWSWKVSVHYRVLEAHRLLQHTMHEKGWTAEDCHNPAHYEQIARDCFVSRARFWTKNIFTLLTTPPRVLLFIVFMVLLSISAPLISLAERKYYVYQKSKKR